LRKILEIFNNESSKDIKPLDVAKSTGIGSNKKAVNSLLHFLKNKKILTLKTGEKGADPRWSRDPSNNTYTGIFISFLFIQQNRIGGVMVSVLTSSVVDRGFEPRSGQTKDYEINIFVASPLSTQH
jgi:hypothetical protein